MTGKPDGGPKVVAALHDILLDDTRRAAFVADALDVVDAEVAGKKGAAGLAVKGGYAAVRKVKPTIVRSAVETLIPQFAERLDPYWADYRAGQGDTFAACLTGPWRRGRGDPARRYRRATRAVEQTKPSRRSTRRMRPSAKRHVIDALPRVGDLVERYAR